MIKQAETMSQAVKNIGWRVTFAGLGINLALGILYTWSVIKKGLPQEGWTDTDRSLPYAVACLVFCLVMVPAGRLQDKVGPRLVASAGGILVGLGMILASLWVTPMGILIGFGVLAGAGIGFGYASATPPAVKWFPSAKTGLIAGLVVSGFGLASVYAAPLAAWLTAEFGLEKMLLSLGIGFLVVVVALAQLLSPPPKGYIPAGQPQPAGTANGKKEEFTPTEMLSTVQFYLLWFMYACGAGAGLMIIGNLARIGEDLTGGELGFVLVAALAIGNGGGRVVAGMLSDKLGRQMTMFGFFVFQAVLILGLSMIQPNTPLAAVAVLAVLSAFIGANYGSNLSLFPSITKDYYGAKNFGMNYGLVFTAWGIGGFMLSILAAKIRDANDGSLAFAYYASATLLAIAAVTTFAVKAPHIAHAGDETAGSDGRESAGPALEEAVAEAN